MNKIINIGNKKYTLNDLSVYKSNEYVPFDIKIINTHMKKLNYLVGFNIFTKDLLYINSKTLWEIMQPIGGRGNHNFHGLTEEDVYLALESIQNPYAVMASKNDRYSIISIEASHFGKQLIVVIEKNASLIQNINAKVNKVVTIYPKDNIDRYINGKNQINVLYIKNKPQYRLLLP